MQQQQQSEAQQQLLLTEAAASTRLASIQEEHPAVASAGGGGTSPGGVDIQRLFEVAGRNVKLKKNQGLYIEIGSETKISEFEFFLLLIQILIFFSSEKTNP